MDHFLEPSSLVEHPTIYFNQICLVTNNTTFISQTNPHDVSNGTCLMDGIQYVRDGMPSMWIM